MSRNEQDGAGFAVGAITGALVGAGLALLFAPKAGSELRGELSESMTSMRDAVARRYRELAERAGVEIENLEERVDAAAETFETGAREMLDSASAAARRETPFGRS
jgi:gas vesicle protein